MITYVRTSLFDSPAQVLVNTVNTVGVMGKGIAKEFKARYPEMYRSYRDLCDRKQLQIGSLQFWKDTPKSVLNFPTKTTWRQPSKIEYVEAGLCTFTHKYKELNISSAAFPPLGCGNGNLDWDAVRPLMERFLSRVDIPVYIHDRQVSASFVPEHMSGLGSVPPDNFYEFISDIKSSIIQHKGTFTTLTKGSPYEVEFIDEVGIRIKRGSSELIPVEVLVDAWSNMQAGILSVDSFSDERARRFKSYLFPVLSSLPYVKTVEIQHIRDGNHAPGLGMYFLDGGASRARFRASSVDQPCLF